MSTGITWTEETWNPIVGCSIVSKGCTNCYAMQWAGQRMDGNPKSPHYAGTTKQVNGHHVWTGKLARAPEATRLKPLRWTRPRMIFVNSMSDLFHEAVPDEWIDQIFAVMALTPQHTYQILTKRPERMKAYISNAATRGRVLDLALAMKELPHNWAWPLNNVWLGVSVEDQATADERIPQLLETPAAVRWISAEPLLGPIDLNMIKAPDDPEDPDGRYTMNVLSADDYYTEWFDSGYNSGTDGPERTRIDWVVAGGESGAVARPMHPEWVRQLRDQCATEEFSVPFFFKQWGEWKPICEGPSDWSAAYYKSIRGSKDPQRQAAYDDIYGKKCTVDSTILHIDGSRHGAADIGAFQAGSGSMTTFKIGKATAGDLLDGVQHHNWPVVS